MKYILNIELTEQEAITITSAMAAAQFNDGNPGKNKGNKKGFKKIYDYMYPQLDVTAQRGIDSVMIVYKEIMGQPSFTRSIINSGYDSLIDDLSKADMPKKRKKK